MSLQRLKSRSRRPQFAPRNDGGDARCLVYERHLADDGAALGLLNHGVADDDVERAFEQDEHEVTGVARLEEGLAGRNYNQIYNNIGGDDRAQAQAFTDTWTWDGHASEGFSQIISNDGNRFTSQTIELIKGLHKVLKEENLLAYLVHRNRLNFNLRHYRCDSFIDTAISFARFCAPFFGKDSSRTK